MEDFVTSVFNNPESLWFAIGFALLAIEILVFGFASGVLLFGGIGALITGALLWFGIVDANWVYSIGCFAVATTLATLVLWFPLKKLQSGTEMGNDRSSDLIGYQFRVDSELTHTATGSHRYSGIDWKVQISNDSMIDIIAAGSLVKVVSVDAGVFYVVMD